MSISGIVNASPEVVVEVKSVAFSDANAMVTFGAKMMSVLACIETKRKPEEGEEGAADHHHHDAGHFTGQILDRRMHSDLKQLNFGVFAPR